MYRPFLLAVALFNAAILGGLVFWYGAAHLGREAQGLLLAVLAILAVVKLAWLAAFFLVGNALFGVRFPAVVGAAAFLVVHWALLCGGLMMGSRTVVDFSIALVEVVVLAGALAAATAIVLRTNMVNGKRDRPAWFFGLFHLLLFACLGLALLTGWGRAEGPEIAPIASSVLMIAYNIFALVWVRLLRDVGPLTPRQAFDRFSITGREREIIELVCLGHTNQEIADRLFISLSTVKDHNNNIFRKTEVRNRVELANLFRGMSDDPAETPLDVAEGP